MSELPAPQPRRTDFIVMPLIGLVTIGLISVAAELLARLHFHESPTGAAKCLDLNDAGLRGRPHAVCREKALESEEVEYRLDSKGYRSDVELGAKQPGVYRIVLIGSSVAMGELVQREQSVGALLERHLNEGSGRKVELYNQGMAFGFARNARLKFQDALDAEPDLILWIVTPLDLARSEQGVTLPPAAGGDSLKDRTLKYIRAHGGTIVIGQVMRHYLYRLQSEDQYIRAFVQSRSPDDDAGFLMSTQGPVWQRHWANFAEHAADMFARAHRAGVPLAVAFAPSRVQAAMVSAGEWPVGYDPYAIDERLNALVQCAGGKYIELLPMYRDLPGSEQLYLPLDGHPTVAGYAFLADALAKKMLRGPSALLPAPAAMESVN